jgi:predicted small lipoprotein YifL
MRKTLSLPALALLASLTACEHPTPLPPPPAAPPELLQPLAPEPPVPLTSDEAATARYIRDLRDFACSARARFNGLAAWVTNGAFADPNAGRCRVAPQPQR